MKWVVLGLGALGLLCLASAWHEANIGGDNPTGDQWERRQAAPFAWLAGIALLVGDFVIWLGYTMVKALG